MDRRSLAFHTSVAVRFRSHDNEVAKIDSDWSQLAGNRLLTICRKQRVDEDARQLMLMKEMLLPDGDLHSDSKRQRKFRWRNVGELLSHVSQATTHSC